MLIKRKPVAVCAILVFFLLVGCATTNYQKPAPTTSQPISIVVSDKVNLGINDKPPGVYNIPNTQILLSGHQKAYHKDPMGFFLGVFGQNISGSTEGNKRLKDVNENLSFALHEMVGSNFYDTISSDSLDGYFTMEKNPNRPVLSVYPILLLNYVSETEIRPFIFFKVILKNGESKKIWATKVYATTGNPKPIIGDNSWTQNSSKALRDSIQISIQRAAKVLLQDIRQPFTRSKSNKIVVQSHFAFQKAKLQIMGYKLAEDGDSLIFIPALGDGLLFAGINVLDKKSITYRPATSGDPVFKVMEYKGK